MEGMGRLQFSDIFFTELPVPPQAAGIVGHLMCLIYILLSTTVSHFLDLTDAFFLQGLLFLLCISIFARTLCMCVMYLTSI